MADTEENSINNSIEDMNDNLADSSVKPIVMRKYKLYNVVLDCRIKDFIDSMLDSVKQTTFVPINMRKYLLYKQITPL